MGLFDFDDNDDDDNNNNIPPDCYPFVSISM